MKCRCGHGRVSHRRGRGTRQPCWAARVNGNHQSMWNHRNQDLTKGHGLCKCRDWHPEAEVQAMIRHAQSTIYWMTCGCTVQTFQIATEGKEEAALFAVDRAMTMTDPVVSRIQRKPGPNWAPVYLVTVRPAHQTCAMHLFHPTSYTDQGASNV